MRRAIVMAGALIFCWTTLSFGQTNPLYIQFQPNAVKGALYKPDSGPAPHVAILVIHRTSNLFDYVSKWINARY